MGTLKFFANFLNDRRGFSFIAADRVITFLAILADRGRPDLGASSNKDPMLSLCRRHLSQLRSASSRVRLADPVRPIGWLRSYTHLLLTSRLQIYNSGVLV